MMRHGSGTSPMPQDGDLKKRKGDDMKHRSAIVAMTLLVVSGSAYAEVCNMALTCAKTNECVKAAAKTQTQCPVMGGAINKKIFVDAEGKRIYLCCNGCIDSVKKEPGKYIAKLEAEGVALEKAPVVVPAEKSVER